MKKFVKRDFINVFLIILLLLFYVLISTNFLTCLYGSKVDWDCQHWAIPDYFRKLFYETGNLFPNFAFNLGNGQNIFYFSYYGLLSPIILISYLFPFIKMVDYIQITSIIGMIGSVILFYKWILNKFDSRTAFLSTIMFVASVPLLFHSHRHIMFVNYMPFLILALMGVDKYFEENKKCLLIISVFLIIMTSYFFSVSSIFLIVIYGIYKFFEKNININFKLFIREGMKFLVPILVSILMSCLVILPTFYVILSGRSDSNVSVTLLEQLIPSFNINKIFYHSYSPGLTALSFIALLFGGVSSKKEDKLLSYLLFIVISFPIVVYVLNGFMYIDYKVLIPFIPLFSLVIAKFINNNEIKSKVSWKKFLLILIIGILLYLFNLKNTRANIFVLELILLTFIFIFSEKRKYYNVFLLLSVFVSSCSSFLCMLINYDKLYERQKFNEVEYKTDYDSIDKLLEQDNGIYRITNNNDLLLNINKVPTVNYYSGNIYSSTSNENYKENYYNNSFNEITERTYGKITSSKNIFYNLRNANKYFIGDSYIPVGYKNTFKNLYVNEDVLPIIYASSNLISRSYYDSLKFPYNMEARLKNIVVEENFENKYSSDILPFNGNVSLEYKDEEISIKNIVSGYSIETFDESKIKLSVSGLEDKDILILKFDVENNQNCSTGDLSITINGIENVLSCKDWKYHNRNTSFEYVISSNEVINSLDVVFSKGVYNLLNIELYKVNYDVLIEDLDKVDEFVFDKEKTFGDTIVGSINVSSDGYLYISIPFDEGFSIYLNGEKREYEMVDNGFIGIKVKKGYYNIEIRYNAPYFKEGIVLSSLGITIYLCFLGKELRKSKKILAKK